jgi:hypothetical protein
MSTALATLRQTAYAYGWGWWIADDVLRHRHMWRCTLSGCLVLASRPHLMHHSFRRNRPIFIDEPECAVIRYVVFTIAVNICTTTMRSRVPALFATARPHHRSPLMPVPFYQRPRNHEPEPTTSPENPKVQDMYTKVQSTRPPPRSALTQSCPWQTLWRPPCAPTAMPRCVP